MTDRLPLDRLIVRIFDTIIMIIAEMTNPITTVIKRYIIGLIPKSAVNFRNSTYKERNKMN